MSTNMTDDSRIEILVTALDWYRSVFVNHPIDFALNYLKADRGKVASDAFDMLEIHFEPTPDTRGEE